MRLNVNAILVVLAAAAIGASLLTLPTATPAGAEVAPGMRCYGAKAAKSLVINGRPLPVAVLDLLQANETDTTIVKPVLICVPASVSTGNDTAVSPEIPPFVCYKTKNAPGTPKFPSKAEQGPIDLTVPLVGNESILLKPSKIVCLPLEG